MSKRSATSTHIVGLYEKSTTSKNQEPSNKIKEKANYCNHLRPRPVKPINYKDTLYRVHQPIKASSNQPPINTDSNSAAGYNSSTGAPKRHCAGLNPDNTEYTEKVKTQSSSSHRSKKANTWGPFIQPVLSSDSEEDCIETSTNKSILERGTANSVNLASRASKKVPASNSNDTPTTPSESGYQSKGTKSKRKRSSKTSEEKLSFPFGNFTKAAGKGKKFPPPQDQPEDLSVKSRNKKKSSASDSHSTTASDSFTSRDHTSRTTTGSCSSTRCRKARGRRPQASTQPEEPSQQQQTSQPNQPSRRPSIQIPTFQSDNPQPSLNPLVRASSSTSSSLRPAALSKLDRKHLAANQAALFTEDFSLSSQYDESSLGALSNAITFENWEKTRAPSSFAVRHRAAAGVTLNRVSSMLVAEGESDQDEADISRLQALLESRNVPMPALLNGLGPRLQQMLHRPPTSGASSKASQLVEVMKTNDESRQLQAVIEMCQILVMGNEDTLTGFPVRLVVPVLIDLLKVEHNFDMMNHSCRAISYMMEALPRSSSVIVQAVPVLLQKLQSIQCMDVAEQSLSALEQLSRLHSSAILNEDGFNACLLYIEFFSLPAQRNALKVAANCCCCSPAPSGNMSMAVEFDKFFSSSIPMLVEKLSHHDKKCLESICLCFARLVDQYHNDVETLKKLGEQQLLESFQNLLLASPPLIGSNTFVMVIKTMYQICSPCPNLANRLVRNNIADTLQYLLCGPALKVEQSTSSHPTILPRSPQELFELTALIRELMPKLPTQETIFSVDPYLASSPLTGKVSTSGRNVWQWLGDENQWINYTKADCRQIEATRLAHRPDVSLSFNGRPYTIVFAIMQQVNDESGQMRPVRKIADTSSDRSRSPELTRLESGLDNEDKTIISQLVRSLSRLLYEVFSSSAGSPPVRQNCVYALKKMIYYAEAELLREILADINISSNLTSMLSSNNLDMIVAALQISILLMEKLCNNFQSLFQRQGVVYQVAKLLDPNNKILSDCEASASTSESSSVEKTSTRERMHSMSDLVFNLSKAEPPKEKRHGLRFSKKKSSQRSNQLTGEGSKSSSRSNNRNKNAAASSSTSVPTAVYVEPKVITSPLTKAKSTSAASVAAATAVANQQASRTKHSQKSSSASNFLATNIPTWNRLLSHAPPPLYPQVNFAPRKSYISHATKQMQPMGYSHAMNMHKLHSQNRRHENDRKVKAWIRQQATNFLNNYFPDAIPVANKSKIAPNLSMATTSGHSLLDQLTAITFVIDGCKDISQCVSSMTKFRDVVTSSDASPFELQHSGVIGSLLRFLIAARSTAVVTRKSTRRRKQNEQVVQHETEPVDDVIEEIHDDDVPEISDHISPIEAIGQYERLRCFLHVFADLPMEEFSKEAIDVGGWMQGEQGSRKMFYELVRKLNMCVTQLEQLPVKLHDVSAVGNRSEALNYFTRNQLKCQLQRHPESPKLKQWPGGAVRVDPLAMVAAIEKYLVHRGYSVPMTGSTPDDEMSRANVALIEEDSDDEIDDTYEQAPISSTTSTSLSGAAKLRGSVNSNSTSQSHRLELYINGHLLQSTMTVYQAVKMYSREGSSSSSQLLNRTYLNASDSSNSSFWNRTHVIHYKHVPVDLKTSTSRKARNNSRQTKRVNFSWSSGKLTWKPTHINDYVKKKFQIGDSALSNDPAKEVLSLLKVLYGLSKHWYMLYTPTSVNNSKPLLPVGHFIISKLSAKCARQVQDPLMIMTGEIPTWVGELARNFPFTLPFETRQLVFRIVAFDRDRAMHYLIDSGKMNEINSSNSSSAAASSSSSYGHHDSSSRFTSSKVEKKKYIVKRSNLLQQGEKLILEHAHQRHIIEVQYDGEVGTGLGPTHEFYTLVGNELQRSTLRLWRDDGRPADTVSTGSVQDSKKELDGDHEITEINANSNMDNNDNVDRFVFSSVGLFPRPIAKSIRQNSNNKSNLTKFRFIGRLLAKSLMDNRLVDLPLNMVFYKWLLGQENSLSWHDMDDIDPQMSLTFHRMKSVLHRSVSFNNENRKRLTTDTQVATGSGRNRRGKKAGLLKSTAVSPRSIDVDKYDEDKQKQNALLTIDGCSIEDLSLDFQLPGYPDIEMMKNGCKTGLTVTNLGKYLNLLAYWNLHEGVRQQMEAVRSGFNSVLSLSTLEYFYPEELDQLFCGARFQQWTTSELTDACRADHGYTLDSQPVKHLFEVLACFDVTDQRRFLQFVTGSPHLPIGGLRAMNPPLTIVRKTCDEGCNPDSFLPSVMTCANYLKLPEYSSKDLLRQRFLKAMAEGQQSFLLS